MASSAAPDLTVGLPVYNGERFLAPALAALLGQDLDFELLIADNASTDATEEICRAAAERDARVRYHRHRENLGANRNFNWLAEEQRSPFFRWAAADDLLRGPVLSRCLDALRGAPDAALAFTETILIDADGAPVRERIDDADRGAAADPVDRFVDVLRNEVWCVAVFGVIRADLLDRTRLLRPFYGADRVLLAELALLGRFVRVDGPAFLRRCHDDQSTSMSVAEKARWTVGAGRLAVPAPALATAAFLQLAAQAPIGPRRRAAAVGAVLGHAGARVERLVRPGPFNYFGWRGRRPAHPTDHLDLRVDDRAAVTGVERTEG